MGKRKKVGVLLVTLITILIITITYFGYKFYLIESVKITETNEITETYKNIGATFNIEKSVLFDKSKQSSFEGINFIKSDNFIKSEVPSPSELIKYDTYYLNYKNDQTFDAFIRIGEGLEIYQALITNNYNTFGFTFNNIDFKTLFKVYNINNDYELQKYIIENYNKDVNLFSSINEIKMHYGIKTIANVTTIIGKIYQIDGDLKGILYNSINGIYEVHLYNNNKQYFLMFFNKDVQFFNLENIQEFLKNISFEENQ